MSDGMSMGEVGVPDYRSPCQHKDRIKRIEERGKYNETALAHVRDELCQYYNELRILRGELNKLKVWVEDHNPPYKPPEIEIDMRCQKHCKNHKKLYEPTFIGSGV